PSTWSMCSTRGARALPRAGCPIQKSPDHRLLPTPRCLSQVAASFFGSWCLGIHLGPLLACSTYTHSSAAENWISVTSKLERGSSFALRHSGDLDRPIRLPMCWWRRADSNCRPPACKAGALPAELRPLGARKCRAYSGALFYAVRCAGHLPPRAEPIRLRGRYFRP